MLFQVGREHDTSCEMQAQDLDAIEDYLVVRKLDRDVAAELDELAQHVLRDKEGRTRRDNDWTK